MGLDMYAFKRTYVKNWNFMKDDELTKITLSGNRTKNIKPERVSYILEEVACWRKANAIHEWFVQNVQNGNDDCGEYFVSDKNLQELLDTCEKVIAASILVKGKISNGYTFTDGEKVPLMVDGQYIKDPSVAAELLPTENGFFFGSTDYDQYYLEDVIYTRDILKTLLAEDGDDDVYYSSSW